MMSMCVHVLNRGCDRFRHLPVLAIVSWVCKGGVEPLLNDTMSLAKAHLSLTVCGLSASHEENHIFQAYFVNKMYFSELHSIVWSKCLLDFVFIWISWAPFIHLDALDCAGESLGPSSSEVILIFLWMRLLCAVDKDFNWVKLSFRLHSTVS